MNSTTSRVKRISPMLAVAAFALALPPVASNAAIEFTGYMKIAGESPKFVLVDTEDRKSSGWLPVGGIFKEFTIVAFDPKTEILSLKKGQATSQLPLQLSRTRDGLPDLRKVIDTSTRAIRDIPETTSRR